MIYIYKTTNLINGMIYIGVHKETLKDKKKTYYGSSKWLKGEIYKYKECNFKKEILFYFNSLKEAYIMEKIIVNTSFIMREDTYNLTLGGDWAESNNRGLINKEKQKKP